jgi:hypothetical protein
MIYVNSLVNQINNRPANAVVSWIEKLGVYLADYFEFYIGGQLIQRIEEIYKPFKKRISLHHVKAHTGLDDEHSIGNAEADRLANLAVGVVVSASAAFASDCIDTTLISNIKESPTYSKHYINVKYEFKDAIKKLGAKWDLRCSKWYYEDNISDANKNAILEIEKLSENDIELHTKIYANIPFKNKDAVRKLGCRWDPEKKSWYYMSNLEKNKIDSIKKLEEIKKLEA